MPSISELFDEYPYSRVVLIVVLVVGLVTVRSCQLDNAEDRMLNAWEDAVGERKANVERSLDTLEILDPALMTCVRRAAMDRAAIHPNSTGGIDDVRELRLLYCPNADIYSLDGIGELNNLTFLDVGRNRIRSVQPLKDHPTLKALHLSDNPVEDLRLVRTMPALKEIYLPNQPDVRCKDIEQWVEGLKSNLKSIRCQRPEGTAIASNRPSTSRREEEKRSNTLSDREHDELLRYEQSYRGR